MRNQYKNLGRGQFSPKLVARASSEEKAAAVARAQDIGITESELIRSALSLAFNVLPLPEATARMISRAGWPSSVAVPAGGVLPAVPPGAAAPRARVRRRRAPTPVAPRSLPVTDDAEAFSFVDLTKGGR